MAASYEPKTWSLDRYARFVPSDKKGQGEWKYFSSYGSKSPMKISIVEPLKLLITSGSYIVLESIPLYNQEKEPSTKAICKGDSMLFFCKAQESVRRFRVKFAKGPSGSERENCQEFTQMISEYVQIKTMESQDDESNNQSCSQSMLMDSSQSQLNSSFEYEYLPPNKVKRAEVLDSKIFSTNSIRQIAESIMKNPTNHYPESCRSGENTMTDKEVDSLLKSCLLDPEFPCFVGQVEESLKRLLSE